MRAHRLLPFVGLLLLAALVAALAGISNIEEADVAVQERDASADALTAGFGRATALAPRLGPAEPTDVAYGDDGVAERAAATATTIDPRWKAAAPILGSTGKKTTCGSVFSGGADADGLVYHACGANIHVRGPKGKLLDVISPGESAPIGRRDVAAARGGNLVYYTVGDRVDTGLTAAQLSAGWGSVHRAKRDANGVWRRDTAFRFGPFKLYGGSAWSARYLTVGSDGTLYTSTNAFIMAVDTAGRVRANEYGQYDAAGVRIGGPIAGYDPAGIAPGFNVVEGLTTSPDGAFLYAVEEDYDFAVRFARNSAGAWVPDRLTGLPTSPGCTLPRLAAPYDIATSATGTVFVANTTCGEIRLYDSTLGGGTTVLKVDGLLPHGLAMAGNGAFIFPYRNEIYARS